MYLKHPFHARCFVPNTLLASEDIKQKERTLGARGAVEEKQFKHNHVQLGACYGFIRQETV